MTANPNPQTASNNRAKRWGIGALIALLILLILWLLRSCDSSPTPVVLSSSSSHGQSSQNEVSSAPLASSLGVSSSLTSGSSSSLHGNTKLSSHLQTLLSSSAVKSSDTIPPKWHPEPIPGIYHEAVAVKLICEGEPKCHFKVSSPEIASQDIPAEQLLNITNSTTLTVIGLDSVGNATPAQNLEYKIVKRSDHCPTDMVPIGAGPEFCMDAYEWPNKRGANPKANVTLKEAEDLCASVGKTLCSSNQWTSACEADKKWRYPYGGEYKESYCNTTSSGSDRSGYHVNCRSWDGVYDLSGNLWEWTSTPARNPAYHLVAGGSWDSRSGTSCAERKYSFFPQNQYPMVGLRCCMPTK